MKPENLKSKIFSDSGDPGVTLELIEKLGFLDGQTTNPSLVAKNPVAEKRIASGDKFSEHELLDFYKQVVQRASNLIPQGSVSIEVYSDKNTKAEEMFQQGQEFFTWIPNAHIKYPTTSEGLRAAEMSIRSGIRVNMTLVFTQSQAAAVHAATRGAKRGDVFVSPFIGRLDDRGENGMDLIKNILTMYREQESHVEVLTASVRTMDHFYEALRLGSDIITAPPKILFDWADQSLGLPGADFAYEVKELKSIPYEKLDLNSKWEDFDVDNELTKIGMEKFTADWKALIK